MATLLGGMVGFLTALVGLFLFGLSPLNALALWSGTGLAMALGLVALGFALRHVSPASLAAARGPQANLQ